MLPWPIMENITWKEKNMSNHELRDENAKMGFGIQSISLYVNTYSRYTHEKYRWKFWGG